MGSQDWIDSDPFSDMLDAGTITCFGRSSLSSLDYIVVHQAFRADRTVQRRLPIPAKEVRDASSYFHDNPKL